MKTDYQLNNGKIATLIGFDDWSRPVMEYKSESGVHRFVLVDNTMHASSNHGEPDYPLSEAFQLKEYDFDFAKGIFIKKEEADS
jgi:hypothetical protein